MMLSKKNNDGFSFLTVTMMTMMTITSKSFAVAGTNDNHNMHSPSSSSSTRYYYNSLSTATCACDSDRTCISKEEMDTNWDICIFPSKNNNEASKKEPKELLFLNLQIETTTMGNTILNVVGEGNANDIICLASTMTVANHDEDGASNGYEPCVIELEDNARNELISNESDGITIVGTFTSDTHKQEVTNPHSKNKSAAYQYRTVVDFAEPLNLWVEKDQGNDDSSSTRQTKHDYKHQRAGPNNGRKSTENIGDSSHRSLYLVIGSTFAMFISMVSVMHYRIARCVVTSNEEEDDVDEENDCKADDDISKCGSIEDSELYLEDIDLA